MLVCGQTNIYLCVHGLNETGDYFAMIWTGVSMADSVKPGDPFYLKVEAAKADCVTIVLLSALPLLWKDEQTAFFQPLYEARDSYQSHIMRTGKY